MEYLLILVLGMLFGYLTRKWVVSQNKEHNYSKVNSLELEIKLLENLILSYVDSLEYYEKQGNNNTATIYSRDIILIKNIIRILEEENRIEL